MPDAIVRCRPGPVRALVLAPGVGACSSRGAPRPAQRCRVLSHARRSGLAVGRVLMALLAVSFAPNGPLAFGIDETLDRRRGKRIAAMGLYRDAVRSSKERFVTASGLRWACPMLLVPFPLAGRTR